MIRQFGLSFKEPQLNFIKIGEIMKKITFNLVTLLTTTFVLNACSSTKEVLHLESKPKKDCSTIFESLDKVKTSNKEQRNSMAENNGLSEPEPDTECKVLPIKISQNVKCEIAGSDDIKNVLEFYGQNQSDRFVFAGPLKSLINGNMLSFQNLMTYYKIKVNIADHVDSDVFNDLKDFRYKGMTCDFGGNKFVSWIGDDRIIASIEVKKEVSRSDKKTKKHSKRK